MAGRSFLQQGVHTIAYKIISLAVVFMCGVLTARWLGPEGKGVLSVYFAATAMIVPLAELGIRQSVAYMAGQKIHPEVEIYAAMKWLYLLTSTICVAVLVGLFSGLDFFYRYGLTLTIIFLAIVPLSLYESYNNGILIARRSIEKINYLALLDKVSTLLFIFVAVVLLQGGVLGAAIAYLASRVINFCVVNFWLREYFLVRPRMLPPIVSQMLKKGFVFAFALFVIQLNYKFSVLILEKLTSAYSVGIYSVGVNFAELLKEVPLALGMVLFSRSANWSGRHLQEALGKAVLLSRIVFAGMVLLGGCLAVVANYCVPLFYGVSFSDSVEVTWMLLPGIVMLSVFLILNLFLAGQGKPYVSIIAFGPALVLNTILNFLLIPRYGVAGAAISSTISYSVATLVFVAVFVRIYKLGFSDVFLLRKDDVLQLGNRIFRTAY